MELPLEGGVGGLDGGQLLELHEGSVHPVLSIAELDQVTVGVADGSVVVDHDALHRLHQTTLDVSCGRGRREGRRKGKGGMVNRDFPVRKAHMFTWFLV